MQVQLDNGSFPVADLRRLPGAHQHIALVPQWDLLDMLADAAGEEPTFTLRSNTEARLLYAGHRVAGVRLVRPRHRGGARAARRRQWPATGASPRCAPQRVSRRRFGAPLDVWWFSIPRRADDPPAGLGAGAPANRVLIDRGDYYQVAYSSEGPRRRLRAPGSNRCGASSR